MKEIPLLDNFYDDIPYLTPDKILGELGTKIFEIVQKYKIKNGVITWIDSKKLTQVLDKCEFIGKDHVRQTWVWNKKVLIEIITIGAPVAAGTIEYLNYYGIKNVVAFGSAGCIVHGFDARNLVVVEKAIRDEGASHHYLPAELYINLNEELLNKLTKFLNNKKIQNIKATTWSTDAFFRETKQRIAKRLSQGAVSVEMECSALASVCKFYGIKFCQFLFFSDIIKNGSWEWTSSLETKQENWDRRTALLELAIEFAQKL